MLLLLFAGMLVVIALLAWSNSAVIGHLRRSEAGPGWWIALVLLWAGGIIVGVYASFSVEYRASETIRVIGAPIPVGIYQWEHLPDGEQWVSYPAVTGMLNVAMNVAFAALLMGCILGLILLSRRARWTSSAR